MKWKRRHLVSQQDYDRLKTLDEFSEILPSKQLKKLIDNVHPDTVMILKDVIRRCRNELLIKCSKIRKVEEMERKDGGVDMTTAILRKIDDLVKGYHKLDKRSD